MMGKMASWKMRVVVAFALVAALFVASPVNSRKVRGDLVSSLVPERLEAAFIQAQRSAIPKNELEAGLKEDMKLVYCKELVLGSTWEVGKSVKVTGRGWRNKGAPVTVSIYGDKPQTQKNKEAEEALQDTSLDVATSTGRVEKLGTPGKSHDQEAADDVKSAQTQLEDRSGELAFLSMGEAVQAGGEGATEQRHVDSSGTDSDKAAEAKVTEEAGDPNGEKETNNGWSPIFQLVVERAPPAGPAPAELVVAEANTSTAPSHEELKRHLLEREKVENLLITGPFTCSVYTVKETGEFQERKKEQAPMIGDESGFMFVISRTLSGYETVLFGWDKTAWKEIHFDNVVSELNTEPKLVTVDENASVNTLRYYLSESMSADLSKCKDPSSGRNDDCQLSDWTEWTSCSTSCGKGEQHRMRSVTVEATGRGLCDLPLTEFKMCNLNFLCTDIKDCKMSDWSEWSECSVTCGDGRQKQTRTILQEAGPGGFPCGALSNTRECHLPPC